MQFSFRESACYCFENEEWTDREDELQTNTQFCFEQLTFLSPHTTHMGLGSAASGAVKRYV